MLCSLFYVEYCPTPLVLAHLSRSNLINPLQPYLKAAELTAHYEKTFLQPVIHKSRGREMAWNSVLTKAGAVDTPPTVRSIGKSYNRSVNHMMRSLVCCLSPRSSPMRSGTLFCSFSYPTLYIMWGK